jgi:hypothetical protein
MDPRLSQTLSNLQIDESTPAAMSAAADETQTSARITPEALKSKLVEKLEATHVEIDDKGTSPDSGTFELFHEVSVPAGR